MTRENILKSLGEIVEESSTEQVDWTKVTESTQIESLGFDSLSILDLIFDIEQTTSIQVEAKDVLDMRTVGEMVSYIAERA